MRGIQLSSPSSERQDDLAFFIAQRGVIVFRDQDSKDKGLEANKKFTEHYGPLHIHPSSGAPVNYAEFHIVYHRKESDNYEEAFNEKLTLKGCTVISLMRSSLHLIPSLPSWKAQRKVEILYSPIVLRPIEDYLQISKRC